MTKLLTIYDWDDTLHPTTELYKILKRNKTTNTNNVLNLNEKINFQMVDEESVKCLTVAINNGDVLIITNAGLGWVEDTGGRYMPKTMKFIIDNNIEIISAADKYKKHTNCTIEWKYYTMIEYFDEHKQYTNVLSIGDSICEKYAIINIENSKVIGFPSIYMTIKMNDDPSFKTLYNQLVNIKKIYLSIIRGDIFNKHSSLSNMK